MDALAEATQATKVCKECGEAKAESAFVFSRGHLDCTCKRCRLQSKRALYARQRKEEGKAAPVFRDGRKTWQTTGNAATGEVFPGAEYSSEEEEWLRALDQWRRKTGVKFPTAVDLLRLLKEQGYRKHP